MASRPLLRKLDKRIEELGSVMGMTGEEWFLSRVADAVSVRDIAEEIGICSRTFMYVWIKHRDLKEKYKEAQKQSADAHAENGLKILDSLADEETGRVKSGVDNVDVTLADKRSRYRLGLAKARDPETYGDKTGKVEISIGSLHLDALRSKGSPKVLAAPEPPEAEWEYDDDEAVA